MLNSHCLTVHHTKDGNKVQHREVYFRAIAALRRSRFVVWFPISSLYHYFKGLCQERTSQKNQRKNFTAIFEICSILENV